MATLAAHGAAVARSARHAAELLSGESSDKGRLALWAPAQRARERMDERVRRLARLPSGEASVREVRSPRENPNRHFSSSSGKRPGASENPPPTGEGGSDDDHSAAPLPCPLMIVLVSSGAALLATLEDAFGGGGSASRASLDRARFGGRLVVLNLTPTTPATARKAAARCASAGAAYAHAAVRGGVAEAEDGALRLFVAAADAPLAREVRFAGGAGTRADDLCGGDVLEDDGERTSVRHPERHHSSDDAPNVPRLFDGLDPSSRSFAFGEVADAARWFASETTFVGGDVARAASLEMIRSCVRAESAAKARAAFVWAARLAPTRARLDRALEALNAESKRADVAEAERAASTERARREKDRADSADAKVRDAEARRRRSTRGFARWKKRSSRAATRPSAAPPRSPPSPRR